ncbi:hypothetical protein FISHEDRAFT_66702 [Fistulina hepatica ATCC 64428]|uniref:TRIP4/RQT4 C2HC5-type zinc finger domain-containing protein n=1 Tax=Fistulina hepatica ATCC 64428 TaxID=1128425 RepID=A0A0D7A5D6_9AGAR|nr:hypothetical protein FISHEDRAFT_66702 [Fistulina hepatica ATCC 64428]
MHRTAWSSNASYFPSDRIRPSNVQPKGGNKQGESSGRNERKNAPTPPPKSQANIMLESLLRGIQDSSSRPIAKDPKGGCFCLARVHSLSDYTPLCRTCGLILCAINLPHHACPHCGTTLLDPPAFRDTLIAQLKREIDVALAQDLREYEQALEEARLAAGAFPALAPSSRASTPPARISQPVPQSQGHKILSLDSKTKKVTVASYSSAPRVSSRSSDKPFAFKSDEQLRVPPPPREVHYVAGNIDPKRPWRDLGGEGATYVRLVKPTSDVPKRRRKNRGRNTDSRTDTESHANSSMTS